MGCLRWVRTPHALATTHTAVEDSARSEPTDRLRPLRLSPCADAARLNLDCLGYTVPIKNRYLEVAADSGFTVAVDSPRKRLIRLL